MKSIMGARFTMTATVLPRLADQGPQPAASDKGEYRTYQDPDSGELKTEFVVDPAPTASTKSASYDIPCYARGYTDLGFRSSAQHEVRVKGEYTVLEAIEFTFPAKYKDLSRNSLITNIRDARTQHTLYTEEETGLPTTYQVQGLTPVFDPFGKLIAWTGVINRSEVQ